MNPRRVALIGGSGFIGFHLTNKLLDKGFLVDVFDLNTPGTHFPKVKFRRLDILEKMEVENELNAASYVAIINLAAITDDKSSKISDYLVNFEGCRNLVDALERIGFQGRFIQISTQYVSKPTEISFKNDTAEAMNAYGESKRLAEEILKKSSLENWVILRPTNVWGSFHNGFPDGFWRMVYKGFYAHPRKPVFRSYGFVESVCDQIVQFMNLSDINVLKQIYYIGDDPIDSYLWVDEFCRALTGKKVRLISTKTLMALAIVGEIFGKIGVKLPLNLKRYRSMTTDYVVDMNPTWEVISRPVFDFVESVHVTAKWYLEDYL
jgi:nucleoside-diphosphate-sugar epimerase